ncbi:MAG TPA: hypothetical protein VKT82_24705 [Ktedonobacterales bacterium]|nr:hypothetical protein [Ktedonobacterales bacterium]
MARPRFSSPSATTSAPAKERKIQQAMAFLQGAMAGQARPAAEVEAEARAAGFTHSTLADARRRLSIRSEKRGAAWYWIPPARRASRRKKQPATV